MQCSADAWLVDWVIYTYSSKFHSVKGFPGHHRYKDTLFFWWTSVFYHDDHDLQNSQSAYYKDGCCLTFFLSRFCIESLCFDGSVNRWAFYMKLISESCIDVCSALLCALLSQQWVRLNKSMHNAWIERCDCYRAASFLPCHSSFRL